MNTPHSSLRTIRLLFLAAFAVPILHAVAQQATPESPAIWREVIGLTPGTAANQGKVTRPHFPSLRTSSDGRVGMRIKGSPSFMLMMPEKLTTPLLLNPSDYVNGVSSSIMCSTSFNTSVPDSSFLTSAAISNGAVIHHCCLYDPADSPSSGVTNPTVSGSNDVYNLYVFVICNYNDNTMQLFATPITVTVTNPKKTTAAISSIVPHTTVSGPRTVLNLHDTGTVGDEPSIVGDGRLLAFRIGGGKHTYTDPVSGATKQATYNICYSYYPSGAPCDVTKWTNFIPITCAYNDPAIISAGFEFALAQFRDPTGALIPYGQDIGGTYPWMDKNAKNLFFTAVGDVFDDGTGNSHTRYPATDLTGATITAPDADDASITRGVCFAGLWSHSKVVLVDNMESDQDYGRGNAAANTKTGFQGDHRLVTLYQPNSGPLGNETGLLHMGAGRDNSPVNPPLDNSNSTILDSLENLFTYRANFFPITIRDVVWPLTAAKQTDDMVFDDFVDPDAFILGSMAGLLSYNNTMHNLDYNSGWNPATYQFDPTTFPVLLQNGATATTDFWTVPTKGIVLGHGRLEPAATGGVHGKGFSMDGTIGLQFPVVAQAQNVHSKNWYVGLFVDCRFANDTATRLLLTFPDSSTVSLVGRSQVIYANPSGVVVNRITLPAPLTGTANPLNDLLPDIGWAHLAFQIQNAGTAVDFYLDGILYNQWQDPFTALFQMTAPGSIPVGQPAGNFTVGQPVPTASNGFVGWVDDLKVLAHTVDFETACNHAGGTLIGLTSSYTGDFKAKFADRYPAWAHQAISNYLINHAQTAYTEYANFHDYTKDVGVHRNNIPTNAVWLRQAVHFPEGPLFYDRPRPQTAANGFCLSCHNSTALSGLNISSLLLDSAHHADVDVRRQPTQPSPVIYGNIPAGLVDYTGQATAQPTSAQTLGAGGQLIDDWALASFAAAPYNGKTNVLTFTLVNADTGQDIMALSTSSASPTSVDPARIGTANFIVRANLDHAQGGVTLVADTGANSNPQYPPYSLSMGTLVAGLHNVVATPSLNTTSLTAYFTLVDDTANHQIANYLTDFQTYSPLSGWSYQWNASGAVSSTANWVPLNWSPTISSYTANGMPPEPAIFGVGGFTSSGGAPGQGGSGGGGVDRYVIAGYTAKLAGTYGIPVGKVTSTVSGGGGQVLLYTEVAGVLILKSTTAYTFGTPANFNQGLGHLNVGDSIYVAVGPNGGTSANAAFSFDCRVNYHNP